MKARHRRCLSSNDLPTVHTVVEERGRRGREYLNGTRGVGGECAGVEHVGRVAQDRG